MTYTPKVKICGITDVETALAACEAGVDALGFVFAESKRQVNMSQAHSIISQLPSTVTKVGVFVDSTKAEIETTAHFCGLDWVQLHGKETPPQCLDYSYPVIKAFRVENAQVLSHLVDYQVAYYLVDSAGGSYQGGNGLTFDWDLLNEIDDRIRARLILAGGLNCENVISAIAKVKPFMVDVSSGVETKGKKDIDKIIRFIAKVKGR